MNSRLYIDIERAKEENNLKEEIKKLVAVTMRLVSKVNKTITNNDIEDMLNSKNIDIKEVDDEIVVKLLRNKNNGYKDYLNTIGVDISNIIFKITNDGKIKLQKEAINAEPVIESITYSKKGLELSEKEDKEIYKNTDITVIDIEKDYIYFKQKHNIKYTLYTNNDYNDVKKFDIKEKIVPLKLNNEESRKLREELIETRNIIRNNIYKLNSSNHKKYVL